MTDSKNRNAKKVAKRDGVAGRKTIKKLAYVMKRLYFCKQITIVMKKLIIILMSITIMVGCTRQQHPLLRQAWGLVEEKPNKAYTLLSKVRTDALTDEEKAEYGLLKTIVAYKIHSTDLVDNDSLISASIAYYNLHGDEWHRGRAYYYRGMLRMYRYGNMLDAIIDFKMAETIAEHADDKELKNHVYDILHHVNIISHNHYQTLRYAHKWLDNSTALKDSVMILKNLLICANAYADINQMDSAHAYLNRTIELAKQTDSSLLPNIYATAYRKSGFQSLARIKKSQIQAYDDSMKYVNRAMQMIDRQQKFDEVRQTKEFNLRLS